MLSKTEEFKNFATLAIDSGNVRFMDPVAPATKTVIKESD
jgi:hypothetical protein